MCKIPHIRSVLRMSRRRLQRKNTTSQITDDISFFYPPPDGGWGWVVVLSAVVIYMFVNGFHSAFGIYMLSLLQTFNASNSAVAWIGSVSYAFIMIFGPVSGKLLVKYGAIKVSIIGVLVVIIGLLGSSYVYDLRVLFLTHGIIVGVGSSMASTPGLIMVSLYFTTRRSFATGLVMAGWAAATFLQNKLHYYLIQEFGWRTSLRVYSGILTICIVAGFAFKPLQKHRTHPSVVDKFQTSPLRGFIVDLSLWKDRIFEVWVLSLGFAKFGFFIPFVHVIKLAGDLGIPVDKASYIMLGLGLSSMVSCLLFGKICDIERINRLFLNQVSILTVGVVYFIIPFCTTFPSLVAICSVLGFFDSGNYVLLPVLTFDLMGAEKMTVAWGFMMAVNSISCFGPPFAGAMYDLFGSYNIGFIVTGICNIAAASILSCIPWLQRTSTQSKKNYLNASVCEMTNTIVSWQSSSPSLGSLSSTYMNFTGTPGSPEESASDYSKICSLKSILKAETVSSKSTNGCVTPHKKEDGMAFLAVECPAIDLDRPVDELAKAEAASFRSVSSVSLELVEHITSPPLRKADDMTFLDVDSHLHEKVESTTNLRPVDELAKAEASAIKSETPEPIPHRKGVAFLDVEDSDSDQEEPFESATDLTLMEDDTKSGTAPSQRETSRSMKQTEHIPHRKEDGVAFLDVKDSDSDQEEPFESATDLTLMEDDTKSGTAPSERETSRSMKQTQRIPHRKEDGVAFLDVKDSDSDQEELFESGTDLTLMEDEARSGSAPSERETSRSMKQTERIPHRKEDGVAFLDVKDSDSDQEELFESGTDLTLMEHEARSGSAPSERETSRSMKQTERIPHRKEDGVAFLDVEDSDSDQGELFESGTDLKPVENLVKSEIAPVECETSVSVKETGLIPQRNKNSMALADAEDNKEQSRQQK